MAPTRDGVNALSYSPPAQRPPDAPVAAREDLVVTDGLVDEVGNLTVEQALGAVDRGLVDAELVLEAERRGKDRSTLTGPLEAMLASRAAAGEGSTEGDLNDGAPTG